MPVDPSDAATVKKLLWSNEVIDATVRERRIGPGGSITEPTSVVATNMRLIIVNRASLGIRKDYEVIPYNRVTSVRLEKGIISSSVFIRVEGYSTEKGLLKNGDQEGEIDGLNGTDAQALADYINKKITGAPPDTSAAAGIPDAQLGGYVYCTNCGAKDDASAKFCKKCGAKLE